MRVTTIAVAFTLSCFFDLAKAQEKPVHTTVYKNDFEKKIDRARWSTTKFGKALGDGYIGPFISYDWASLNVPRLGPHKFVRVRARLIVARSLDGTHPKYGPDNWAIGADGSGVIFLTSFGISPEGKVQDRGATQSFPDEFPVSGHPPMTGAVAKNSLGFKTRAPESANADSTYDLDLVFPHDRANLDLYFFTFFDPQQTDETWAISNIEIETISGPELRTQDELAQLWKDLSGKDPLAAHRAVWKLAASGEAGLAYVEKQIENRKNQGKDPKLKEKFAAQLAGLDSAEFVERAAARSAILKLGADAIPLIEAAAKKRGTPAGVKQALRQLSKRLTPPTTQSIDPLDSRIAHLRRLFRKRGRDYKITASRVSDPVLTANDGLAPTRSTQNKTPRFTYWNVKGTTEWLQYEFPEKREVSAGEVYWLREYWSGGNKLPKAWRLKWLDTNGKFQPVKAKGAYGIAEDKFNRVEFDPVETTAIRLEFDISDSNTTGIHEFRLDEKPLDK